MRVLTNNSQSGVRLFRLAALAAWLLVVQAGLAQTEFGIEGVVIDDSTGLPVPSANVTLSGTALGTATDEEGRFVLTGIEPGKYELVVEHLAYEPRTVAVTVGTEIRESVRIELVPRVLWLQPVQVSGSHPEERLGVTVLSAAEIARSGASTLADLLRAVPGVEVQPSPTGTRIAIRGGNSNQVLVVLDGVPLNDPVLGSAEVAALPVALLESVRVVRGPASAEYGAGAVAGVLELTTRKDLESGATVDARVGSYGLRTFAPAIDVRLRGQSLHLSVSQMRFGGGYDYKYAIGSKTKRSTRLNSAFSSLMTGLNWKGLLPKGWRSFASLSFEKSARGIPGSIYALSPYARGLRSRWLFSWTAKARRLGGELSMRVAGKHAESEFVNRISEIAPIRYRSVPPYHTRGTVRELRISARWLRRLSKGKLSGGVEGDFLRYRDHDLLREGEGPVGQAVSRLFAIWMQGTHVFPIWSRWLLTVREEVRLTVARTQANEFGRIDEPVSPGFSLQVGRESGAGLTFVAEAHHAFRLPTYGDLFYQEYRVRGNPNLRPERAWETSLGVMGKHGFERVRARWEIVRYRRLVRDQIIWRLGSFGSFSPTNVDARVDGVEVNGGVETLGRKWRIDLGAETLHTENLVQDATVHGKALPFRPDYRWKISVEHRFRFGAVSWIHRVSGPRWVTEANTVRLPGFQLDDVIVRTEIERGKLRWRLSLAVFNLWDRQYEVVENAPQPGREWRLGVSVEGIAGRFLGGGEHLHAAKTE